MTARAAAVARPIANRTQRKRQATNLARAGHSGKRKSAGHSIVQCTVENRHVKIVMRIGPKSLTA